MSQSIRPIQPKPPASDQQTIVDSPEPSVHRKQRGQIAVVACNNCRSRKAKCDGRRPSCSPCMAKDRTCVYAFPATQSRSQAQRQTIQALSSSNAELRSVLDMLRSGSEEDALAALKRIRTADTLEESIDSVFHETRLLPRMDQALDISSNINSECGERPTLDGHTSSFLEEAASNDGAGNELSSNTLSTPSVYSPSSDANNS